MKKIVLPLMLSLAIVIFLSPEAYAQTNTDCHEVFNKESNSCLKESSKCIDSCVDKANKAMSLTVDGGKVNLECQKSVCDPASEVCNNKTKANFKACQDAGKQLAAAEAKQEDPKQDGVPVFIGEWFSRFSQTIDGLIALPGAFADVVYEDKFYLAGDFPKLSEMSLEDFYQGNWYPNNDTPDRSPNITVEDEQKVWDSDRLDTPLTEKVNITVLGGEAQIKSPDSPQFIPIGFKGGDTLKVTFLDSTIRSTLDSVQLRHTWSPDSGAVINVSKWSEIKFRKPVEVEGVTSHTVELGQGEVEVKVRNNKPAENQFGIDAGWLGVTVSRTHFWVSQSQDKKLAVIGVYEGEVEVKTKDGKTIKVKPDGDNPGVVVVSKKLSPIKLGILSLVIAGTIGGAIWAVKRKSLPKTSKKESRRERGFSHPVIILGVVAVAVLLLYFSANSNKNSQTTQETPQEIQEQTKEEIKDVPNPVNEFLNKNDIKGYEEVGMKVYTGNTPPSIEGLYASDSLVVFYDKPFEDSAPVGTEVSSYNHQFYDQKSDGTIKLKRIPLDGRDEAEGVGGFISGDNNCFSIFVDVKDQLDQCITNQATIYSACKTEAGLEGLQAGFILKEQTGSGCGKVVPVGHLRIITEDDGLAERIE